ncbi:BA14K family protein [Shinella sp.]|uniref:BA14K family protein n=1 Tax=Shinella sp. TaxID=1870904 RepID=UPI0039E2DC3B
MNKVIKAIVLSAAAAATMITATAGVAEARDRDGYWGNGHRPYYRRHHNNDALVGGALGLATGMIIGGAIASQPRYEERRVYVEPDYYPEPERRVIYREAPSYEPWTQSWYRFCSQRYRSFDPNSGTYVGYDGREHFCTAG